MTDAIETFEHNGFKVKLCLDPEPMNPRKEFDHFTTLACWHRRQNLGDAQIVPTSAKDLTEEMGEEDILAILPLYIYEHGGITMRTGAFSDQWDSGQVGWGYVTREQAKQLGSPPEGGESAQAYYERVIREEVAEYDQYLTGQVYGYIVEDEDGDHIDSCWGFYGDLDYVRTEAKSAAEHARRPGQVDGACNASCT